ncbi:hypothetical protein ScPMuIL_015195 [Solemya velum]
MNVSVPVGRGNLKPQAEEERRCIPKIDSPCCKLSRGEKIEEELFFSIFQSCCILDFYLTAGNKNLNLAPQKTWRAIYCRYLWYIETHDKPSTYGVSVAGMEILSGH